jgi:hypothetical protein
MPEEIDISIIPADVSATNFLIKSWLLGASAFNDFYFNDKTGWNQGMQELIKQLLIRGIQIDIAVDPEDPEQFLGWIAHEEIGSQKILHWVYVKRVFRQNGICKALLMNAGWDLQTPIFCSMPSTFHIFYQDKPYKPVVKMRYLPIIASRLFENKE